MQEYVTDAIVLSIHSRGEADRVVDCYTKQLGRIEARMIGGRKPLSKLSPHCVPGGFVTIRLVEKNQFTLIDAFQTLPFRRLTPAALRTIALVRALTPKGVPDNRLWETLKQSLEEAKGDAGTLFRILGYDTASASCEACGDTPVSLFSVSHHEFFCDRCGARLPEGDIVYCS